MKEDCFAFLDFVLLYLASMYETRFLCNFIRSMFTITLSSGHRREIRSIREGYSGQANYQAFRPILYFMVIIIVAETVRIHCCPLIHALSDLILLNLYGIWIN